jgi:hypothetical protein
MNRIIFITGFLFSLHLQTGGQTIYVAPWGNDHQQGTKEQPLQTLAGARDKIRELRRQNVLNDTVFVRLFPGVYPITEAFTLTGEDSGAPEAPVVYAAASDERPVVCGGMAGGRFEAVNAALWRIFIPETRYGFRFEQLYINNERRFRAQTPNRGEFFSVGEVEQTLLDSAGSSRFGNFAVQKVRPLAGNAFFLKDIGNDEVKGVLSTFYHNWDVTRKLLSHINPEDSSFYIAGRAMQQGNSINEKSRYILENYRKALDAPGEWFLDRDGYLYYIPLPGETPENVSLYIPVSEKFLIIKGSPDKPAENIRFENIIFSCAAFNTPVGGNEPYQAASNEDAAVMLDHARRIEFLNCDFSHTGLHGVWFRENCSHSRMEHCHLYDLGGGGVKIGTLHIPQEETFLTKHITVNNCIIHHGGNVFASGVGVIIYNSSDNYITHNEISDFRYTGVSAGWVWGYAHSPSKRNHIDFNHIHHLGWGELCDMGGVYTLGASEGTTVNNNVIHHIYSYEYGGWGLYTDEGSFDVTMANNLVYACKNAGFHQHYGKENHICNNIFACNLIASIQFSRIEQHLSYHFTNNIVYLNSGAIFYGDNILKGITDYDYNCYWDTRASAPAFAGLSFVDWKQAGHDSHSVISDPLFADPANFDFHIKNKSLLKKIHFKPFDFSQAGVYGDEEWKQKAQMSQELLDKYDAMAAKKQTNQSD